MRKWMVIMVLGCSMGCGAGTMGALMPVLEETLRLAEEAAKAHGADLSKAPVKCEQDYDPKTQKLLLMCEADLAQQVMLHRRQNPLPPVQQPPR
jgi:hypothetical protein